MTKRIDILDRLVKVPDPRTGETRVGEVYITNAEMWTGTPAPCRINWSGVRLLGGGFVIVRTDTLKAVKVGEYWVEFDGVSVIPDDYSDTAN